MNKWDLIYKTFKLIFVVIAIVHTYILEQIFNIFFFNSFSFI